MKIYRVHTDILRRIVKSIAAAIAVFAIVLPIFGCAVKPSVSFSVTELELKVGDSRDILPYALFSPSTADDKRLTLRSDGDCVTVNGTTITAVKPGTAVITAESSGGKASIAVSVEYRAAQNLSVAAVGNTVQTVDGGDAEKVTFTAELDDYIDPSTAVEWRVNGEVFGNGTTFEFTPDGYGEYKVTASAQGLTCERDVLIYRKTDVSGKCSGKLEQFRDYSPVVFSAREKIDTRNPRSVYEWRINGSVYSHAAEFVFTPRAVGEYNVELTVNGVKREIDGKPAALVRVTGDRAPKGRVEFDDTDGVYVVWNDGAPAVSVTVKSPAGETAVYSRADVRHSYRFSDGTFDADGIISVTAANPAAYEVTVTADSVGESFEFMQYPSSAAVYINRKVLCRNSFITDADDCAKYVEELYACGMSSAQAYLSREAAADAKSVSAVETAAKTALKLLGITASVSVTDGILNIEFEPYANAPTVAATSSAPQTHTTLPHIATADRRPVGYILPIERATESVSVENTEQLLTAVNRGVRPEAKENSAAASAYALCRAILLNIMERDFTDTEKVHAVYDWLQFSTRRVETDDGTSADYLEGVFGGSVSAGCAVTSRGAAKAFALMCGMEGIECKIAATDGNTPYFWNKVKLDGLWYNVDAYGGEVAPSGTNTEYTSHSRLFIGDAKAKELGLVSAVSVPEAFDDGKAEYLHKSIFGGVYCDNYICEAEASDYEQVRSIVFGAFSDQAVSTFTMLTPRGSLTVSVDECGAEIMLDPDLDAEKTEKVSKNARRAAVEYFNTVLGSELDETAVNVRSCGDLLLISVQKHR